MKTTSEPKSLCEVRAWKAACNREVAGLSIAHAVRKRLADSEASARRAGFPPPAREDARVAEAGCGYGAEPPQTDGQGGGA